LVLIETYVPLTHRFIMIWLSIHGHKTTFYFLWHRPFTPAWHLDRLWGPPYLLSVVAGRRGLSTFANIALV
jgi:hypothetical protein